MSISIIRHPFRMCAFAASVIALAWPAAGQDAIRLTPEQIPDAPASLAVLRLSPQKPPTNFVQETLRRADPKLEKLVPLAQLPGITGKGDKIPPQFVGALSDGELAGYVDLRSGDTEIFPSLTRQKPVPEGQEGEQIQRAERLAREIFARPDLLQKDATEISFDKPRPLYGETAERAEGGSEAKASNRGLYLTYVPVRRSIDKYFVYGPGSRAMLVVGNDGSVQGLVRRWKAATASGNVREARSKKQVMDAILAQLRPTEKTSDVEVMAVEIAYYDSNREYLQPVYRFTAKVHERPQGKSQENARHVDDDFVEGYVPIGKPLESLPSLLTPPGVGPITPKKVAGAAPKPGDPTVGRYVVRNDDPGWVASANGFWGGLNTFFGGLFFTNSQYYWAYPFEFSSNEASYVNSVNVALNEVHGDWWLYSTRSNCCDLVDLTTIPASQGYGPANGGRLAYWILHSCEVVASAADAPCPTDQRPWWTPWFNLFRGMHTVVGYRTIMWITDGTTTPYAVSLRFGAPVVSAWFNATTSAPGYQGNPTFPAHCGRTPPMGRPSTVSACGRQNDSIYNLTPIPAANCLVNFWQPN